MEHVKGDMLVGEIVARYPQVVPVFLKYGLHCVGCRVSPFETIEEGSMGHGMPKDVFEKMIVEANELVTNSKAEKVASGGESKPVWVTEKAAVQIRKIAEGEGKAGFGLRISVQAGGCAGHSYQMDFEEQPDKDDVVIEAHGIKVFYSSELDSLIHGTTIDYREALQGAGFVMQNPNAKTSCGCGQSFA
jgi:iron-sulfur cluster assembly protein